MNAVFRHSGSRRAGFTRLRRSVLYVAVCLWTMAAAGADEFVTASGPTMGTGYSIKVAQPPAELTSQVLKREVESYLAEFDRHVSTYRPDSDLSRFNAYRGTEWFDVQRETALVVQQALQIAQQSQGAFDPTVGPLIRLWGFDRRQGRSRLPTEQELAAALSLVGYQHVAVRFDPPALRKAVPAAELDVNGIAPGYAVDRLVERLAALGLRHVMVDIGGEIRATGRKVDGSSWRIGIERPASTTGSDSARALQAAVPLDEAAVATSGDYRNVYELDGARYSHTIDPRTGRPVHHALASVTIIADDAATADGMATALMVLGPEDGIALADRLRLQAWLQIRDEGGGLVSRASAAFQLGAGRHLEDFLPSEQSAAAPPVPLEAPSGPQPSAEAASTRVTEGTAATPDAEATAATPWTTLLLALAVFGAAMTGLALGLLLRGRPLPGSCGGLAGLRDAHGHPLCSSCTTPPEQCEEFRQAVTRGATRAQEKTDAPSEPRPSGSV